MNYEEQNKEFTAWFEKQTQGGNEWTTLERLAAHDAWMEAHKRALNLFAVVGQSEQLKAFVTEVSKGFDDSHKHKIVKKANDILKSL